MTTAVVAGALVVTAVNALAAASGAWYWRWGGRARPFWLLLRAGQACALVFALGVGVLAAAGRDSTDSLFYLYALLPLAVGFVAEQLRIAAAQTVLDQLGLEDAQAVGRLAADEQHSVVAAILHRELSVMALSALVVVVLAARAAGTAHGF